MTDAKPRVLFVAHTAALGGPTHSLLVLLRYLKARYEVAVLLPEQGPACSALEEEGVRQFMIPGLTLGRVREIHGLIKQEAFDLIYGNNPSGCARNAMLAAKIAGRPFVWHLRGVKNHWTWRKGLFLRMADTRVAVSQACANSIQRFIGKRDTKVVYNGVELGMFAGDRCAARSYLTEQIGLPSGARCLLSVAQLTPRKGHEHAVRLMARVVERAPDAHLLIAGALDRNRRYADDIRRLIQSSNLGEHIHLLGFRRDLPSILPGCDALIHTAKQDPHPRAVLEAMAAGIPVVAFAVDGVAETVDDGETGRLLRLGDEAGMASAISGILESPKTAEDMGRKGKERASTHFTAERTAMQIADIIDGLLSPRPPAPAASLVGSA